MKKIITLLVLILVGIGFGQNQNVEMIKETYFNNAYNDAKIVDSIAYLAADGKFFIYNVSDKAKPKLIKYMIFPNNLLNIHIKGDYAYISAGEGGVIILNITNRTNPIQLESVAASDSTLMVKFSGNKMFVADFLGGLKVYNMEDPANPILMKQVLQNNYVLSVDIKDTSFAYVTIPDSGIAIVKFSDTTAIDTVGKIPILNGGIYFSSAVKDSFLYVLDYYNGIRIFSISQPKTPQFIKTITTSLAGTKFNLIDNYLYVLRNASFASRSKNILKRTTLTQEEVEVFDLTDPLNPNFKYSIDIVEPNNCNLFGNILYVSCNNSLKVYDVSTSSPIVKDSVERLGEINYTLIDGNNLYLGTSKAGLVVLDITDISNPKIIARYLSAGAVYGMSKRGNYLYITCDSKFQVLNVSNLPNITFVSNFDFYGFDYIPRRVTSANDSVLYVAGGSLPGLSALRINSANTIMETDRYGYGILPYASFSDMVCKDTMIYAINNHNAFFILSITPYGTIVPWYIIGEGGFAGISLNNKVYIAAGNNGLKIIDITNPLLPISMASFPTNGDARGIKAIGDIVYIANGYAGLDMINVANPAAPYRIGRYSAEGYSSQLSVKGDYIFSANLSSLGIYKFNYSLSPSIEVTKPNGGENFIAGTTQQITWNSTNVTTVKIEYSTNSGLAWTLIANFVSTSPSIYNWVVPNTPSTQCKVRITSSTNSAIGDTSNAIFTISLPPSITITAPIGGEQWVVSSEKNITWTSINVSNVKIDYTTNAGTNWAQIIGSVSASAGTYKWLIPNTPSINCKVKISSVINSSVSSESNTVFSILDSSICKNVSFFAGWNLLSVPVVASNMTGTILFPTVASNFYKYNNSYLTETNLAVGTGYWAKFNNSGTSNICGNAVSTNQVSVVSGWNMIGGYDKNVLVSGITSNPSGIIASAFFEYNNGYLVPDSLIPGKGYWVKVSQNGNLILPATALSKTIVSLESGIRNNKERVIISDKSFNSYTLYLTKEQTNLSQFELPPAPPAGVPDVRFASDRYVENLNMEQIIKFSGLEYPIKIKVIGTSLILQDFADGKLLNGILKDGEEIVISNNQLNNIKVKIAEIPNKFTLMQNYPNPFNPSTIIKFGLAENVKVSLKVYNQIGQLVTELLSKELESGYHQVVFDATNYASGIYFYEINAGSFREVKKMLLIK